jgi:hypothetical protein
MRGRSKKITAFFFWSVRARYVDEKKKEETNGKKKECVVL